jgi:hypothetical protein
MSARRPRSLAVEAACCSAAAAAAAATMAAIALPARAADAADTAAASVGTPIVAVWTTTGACEDLTAKALVPSPDAAAVQRARLVELPKQKMQFHVPSLAGVPGLVVRTTFDDKSRGVSDNYVVLASADTAPPIAAVVVTEPPHGVDSREKVFDMVVGAERRLAAGTGTFPTFDRVDGPYGETLEMRVPGRTTSPCFPTTRFQAGQVGRVGGTTPFEISRFVFVSGRLVEFALEVAMPGAMTLEDQEAKAKAAMDDFWGGLSVF